MDRYIQTLQKLNNINKYRGMKLTLENISKGCELVGNPQKSLKFIHVAGTNGKGSVCLKLQKIFQAADYKCGIYTSPHLFTYQERIMVNSNYIEKDYVIDTLETLFPLMEKHNVELTFFEYLTIVAFKYYQEQNVDLAVLETGLGGILDSTNIIDKNLAAVITSIGFDHVNVLGYTLEAIASKKAGIIKDGCPTIIGPNAKPLSVFQDVCKEKNSELFVTLGNEQSLLDYNIENNLIVQQTIDVLKSKNMFTNIQNTHIQKGLEAQQKCRLEPLEQEIYQKFYQKYNKNFNLFFDVGHNSQALEKTFSRIKKQFPTNRIKVIYGTSSTKDSLDSLEVISKFCDKCYLIKSNHYRSMEIQNLVECSEKLKLFNSNWEFQIQPIIENGNINSNFDNYFNTNLQDQDVVLVVGSFFIMRQVREYFGYKDLKDPMELNERVTPIKKPEEK